MMHKVLIIGGEHVMVSTIVEKLKVDREVILMTYVEALVPHHLRASVDSSDLIVLIATDSFLGLSETLDNILVVTESVVDMALDYGTPMIMLSSVLALGRAPKQKKIAADMPWSDDPDWHERSYLLHLVDRIYWRGVAEGMAGHSILLPIVATDDARSSHHVHAHRLLAQGVYPQGEMALVALDLIISRLASLLDDGALSNGREILMDRQVPYKDWLNNFATRHNLPQPSEAIATPQRGIKGWLQKMLGRNKGYDAGYLRLLTTPYQYVKD